ncbi:hypothetical protein [Candidatus Nitrosacidococcus sp. I8]|uniref:hypothetical protein n=1 Tax=Candidatus Nitrosacidococcus sp. I8 TaxID=2942908 RepID=UPI002227FA88|nr:hypothetical protein [Candidatus Nitrosacidococcus sp. I8]
MASVEGLQHYARGDSQIKADLKRYSEQFPKFSKNAKGEASNERVNHILSRMIFYAGHIQSDIIDVSLYPAQNEDISENTAAYAEGGRKPKSLCARI